MKRLALFCDYGLDDAVATCDLLLHAKEYRAIDIVAIGGNVPSEVALKNAIKLTAAIGCGFADLRIVDTTDIFQPHEFLKEIHGDDGMGDLLDETSPAYPIVKFDEWLKEDLGEFDLLSLGPMTLVLPLLKKKTPQKFYFMGGNIRMTPNYGEYEFNHGVNAEAFSECVKYPHAGATMDSCMHPLFDILREEKFENDLMGKLLQRARELSLSRGEEGCFIWDDVAVKALRHPEWFVTEEETDPFGNKITVVKYIGKDKYLSVADK